MVTWKFLFVTLAFVVPATGFAALTCDVNPAAQWRPTEPVGPWECSPKRPLEEAAAATLNVLKAAGEACIKEWSGNKGYQEYLLSTRDKMASVCPAMGPAPAQAACYVAYMVGKIGTDGVKCIVTGVAQNLPVTADHRDALQGAFDVLFEAKERYEDLQKGLSPDLLSREEQNKLLRSINKDWKKEIEENPVFIAAKNARGGGMQRLLDALTPNDLLAQNAFEAASANLQSCSLADTDAQLKRGAQAALQAFSAGRAAGREAQKNMVCIERDMLLQHGTSWRLIASGPLMQEYEDNRRALERLQAEDVGRGQRLAVFGQTCQTLLQWDQAVAQKKQVYDASAQLLANALRSNTCYLEPAAQALRTIQTLEAETCGAQIAQSRNTVLGGMWPAGGVGVALGMRMQQCTLTARLPPAAPSTMRPVHEGSYDMSGIWRMNYNWSVTGADFEGTVSGSPRNWTFKGRFVGGGNAIWHPKSGEMTCSGNGTIGTEGTVSCTATIEKAVWQAQARGMLTAVTVGSAQKFQFKGRGTGTNEQGVSAGVDNISLHPK